MVVLRAQRSFQSTRPRGARPHYRIMRVSMFGFQSTRPRGAQQAVWRAYRVADEVSIHAPTRGATRSASRPSRTSTEFQSTRPRGARPFQAQRLVPWSGFNPRAHEGRDPQHGDLQLHLLRVSIHAPTRGATSSRPTRSPRSTGFNPRAHEGRDGQSIQRYA